MCFYRKERIIASLFGLLSVVACASVFKYQDVRTEYDEKKLEFWKLIWNWNFNDIVFYVHGLPLLETGEESFFSWKVAHGPGLLLISYRLMIGIHQLLNELLSCDVFK